MSEIKFSKGRQLVGRHNMINMVAVNHEASYSATQVWDIESGIAHVLAARQALLWAEDIAWRGHLLHITMADTQTGEVVTYDLGNPEEVDTLEAMADNAE